MIQPVERCEGRGSERAPVGRRASLALSVGVTALAFLIPAGASGHGGEVHSDEPAPAVVKPDRGEGAAGGPVRPKARGAKVGAGAGKEARQEAAARTGSDEPSAPEVPESNPTVHFLILGVVAILGAGFILLRRRNALG